MPKVFLSHSSKDKGYVEIVAQKLGRENIVYDAFTFEEGNKTIDEIYSGLDESDIFVFFISNESLDSEWVRKEINYASTLLSEDKIKRFYPIIIDTTSFNDKRIPSWIQEYNLRNVSQPKKAAQRIFQKLKLVSWELYPKNKEMDQLFIGRYDLKKAFNERIFDFDKPSPITVIISGFRSVGRRKFLLHSLRDSNKIKKYYTPLTIFLHSRTSIEDFLYAVYDLGYSKEEYKKELLNLMSTPIDKKITIAVKLLEDIYKQDNKLLIIDNYSIVGNNEIAEWYLTLINQLKDKIQVPFLFLISLSKVPMIKIRQNNSIFCLNILELEKRERNDLFQAILDIEQLSINNDDKRKIAEIFTGFPDQIKYAVDYIKKEGCNRLINNLSELVDYNTEMVSNTLIIYEKDEIAMNLLVLFSHYEVIGYSFLEQLFNGLSDLQKKLLSEFANNFIIEFYGATGEYIRLNDGIRDYIQRSGLRLSESMQEIIRNVTKKSLKDYKGINDYSEYTITIQEALINDYDIPNELLIPSHFLLAMRELYSYHRNYTEVIKLADKVLQNSQYFDQRIVHEIKYWLCLSLARKRDNRFLREVQNIRGVDHNFLMAFYYRLTRRYSDALEKLKIVLDERPNFYMAKRELVQVYLNIEDYDSAFDLAKENYNSEKNNPYHIQSYLKCLLIKSNNKDEASKTILFLLEQLKKNPNEKSLEMYYS
jgi:hypothetical protein